MGGFLIDWRFFCGMGVGVLLCITFFYCTRFTYIHTFLEISRCLGSTKSAFVDGGIYIGPFDALRIVVLISRYHDNTAPCSL
jgi:hypothetical protein